jgi:hypothetical protein
VVLVRQTWYLVATANQWAQDVGLLEQPRLEAKTIGKMGLKGVPGLLIEKSPGGSAPRSNSGYQCPTGGGPGQQPRNNNNLSIFPSFPLAEEELPPVHCCTGIPFRASQTQGSRQRMTDTGEHITMRARVRINLIHFILRQNLFFFRSHHTHTQTRILAARRLFPKRDCFRLTNTSEGELQQ